MYEYVSKREYALGKKEVELIIRKVQRIMREEYNTTFQFELIGSVRRRLVTRVKDGNKGYDFDYNLILQKSDLWGNPKKLKNQFMKAFEKAIKGTAYGKLENSTSVITMKVVDKKHSKIIRGCDFAIIYYVDDDNHDNGYKYIRRQKNGNCVFEMRKKSRAIESKLEYILEYEDGWGMIRYEYLKLKNSNEDCDKKSFILYLESVHNVCNQLKQYEEHHNHEENRKLGFYNAYSSAWIHCANLNVGVKRNI